MFGAATGGIGHVEIVIGSMKQMGHSASSGGIEARQSHWQVGNVVLYKSWVVYFAILGLSILVLCTDTMAVTRAALLTLLTPTALGASLLGQRQANSPPTVDIQNGTVQGVYQPTYHQDLFLGTS